MGIATSAHGPRAVDAKELRVSEQRRVVLEHPGEDLRERLPVLLSAEVADINRDTSAAQIEARQAANVEVLVAA